MSTGKEVDREKVAKEWKARGFSCDLWVDPPGQVWEDYVHSTDELLMLMEGALELEMQGRTFRPAVGEEVLIPAHTSAPGQEALPESGADPAHPIGF